MEMSVFSLSRTAPCPPRVVLPPRGDSGAPPFLLLLLLFDNGTQSSFAFSMSARGFFFRSPFNGS